MLRNKSFRRILLFCAVVIFAAAAFVLLFPSEALTILLVCICAITAVFLWYTALRLREIARLSDYLRAVGSQREPLDVRDNEEGELSLLKNEIYKVTVMLQEQSKQLGLDKIALANSISDISHQLKTPLTSMLVMTDLLCDADLPQEKREEFTHSIRTQLERMQWLLSSLLKLSRLDAGTIAFRREEIAIGTILDEAAKPLLIPFELKAIDFSIEGDRSLPLLADRNWLAEVFVNLFKNAVEHTPEGGRITVCCSGNPLYLEVTVTDTGSGIDRSDLPHIFTRFHRGKNASSDSVGIGLAMAKGIVESHGGSITVKSEPGHGACFTVRLYRKII